MPAKNPSGAEKKTRRSPLKQEVVPKVPLKDALEVARALNDNYAGDPTDPLDVARALGRSPQSSAWRDQTGAALAYGLTTGAYNASVIGLTDLGQRAVAPTEEGADVEALQEAAQQPSAFRTFLQKYDGKKFPQDSIAQNVLVSDCGVPRDRAERTLGLLKATAETASLITVIKDATYVQLRRPAAGAMRTSDTEHEEDQETDGDVTIPEVALGPKSDAQTEVRIFISHGKNQDILDSIKEIVTFGKFAPVVSVEIETPSKPVPDKVMDDMRSCFGAVIHVATDEAIVGEDGKPRQKTNDNVLIEIGAARALYRNNVILLVADGTDLPSNLQGLYVCRYQGDHLDGAATMKLLKAFNGFRGP